MVKIKDVINGYVYVEKISLSLKLSMQHNVGVANLSRTWCSTWLWSDPPWHKEEEVEEEESAQCEQLLWYVKRHGLSLGLSK